MTWTKSVTLWCDGCDDWFGGLEGETVAEVRKDAAEYGGWSHSKRTGKDYCAQCAKTE